MKFDIKCPKCNAITSFSVSKDHVGKKLKCCKCGHLLTIVDDKMANDLGKTSSLTSSIGINKSKNSGRPLPVK